MCSVPCGAPVAYTVSEMPRPQHEQQEISARSVVEVLDLGRIDYHGAYELQCMHRDEVLSWRELPEDRARPVGRLLLMEHDPPVVTISKRKGAREHLVASDAQLEAAGVTVEETDRGGDITYHGPGQLVAYPIVDLSRMRMNLHSYMRFLEQVLIDTCSAFDVEAHRDSRATGVWVGGEHSAKIGALGVRVRRWVAMHGLALNVTTELSHFDLIVACGLTGRSVTSLERELGSRCPEMVEVKRVITECFERRIAEAVCS